MVLVGVTIDKKVRENVNQAERKSLVDSKSARWYIAEQFWMMFAGNSIYMRKGRETAREIVL